MTEDSAGSGRTTRNPVRSYRTRFTTDEDPVSEGGMWINGQRDGVDWADVVVSNGVAYGATTRMTEPERRGEQGNLGEPDAAAPRRGYDDPTAVLGGEWGRNQYVRGKVFSRHQTDQYFQEVEIRLRSTIAPHVCTGYEVFFRCLKTGGAYGEIVRRDAP